MKSRLGKKFFSFDTETKNGSAFICSCYGFKKAYTHKIKSEKDVTDLLEMFLNKKFGNVGFAYNLDYDVLALLKYFGDDLILRLYLLKKVMVKDFEVGYIAKKFLYIQKGKQVVYVFELMQYFNMSLDKAGEIYLNERKDDFTKEEKKRIYEIYLKDPKRVIKYCEQDARLTTRLAEKLDSMFVAFGLNVNKFYSCGYMAKAYLKLKNIHYKYLTDETIQNILKGTYFGGRIEFLQKGFFNDLYQYDINSAYPYACAKLENIISWKMDKRIDKSAKYFFIDCDIDIKSKYLSPLAYRDKNLIIYPSGYIRQRVDNYTYATLLKENAIVKTYDCLNVYTDGTKPFEKMINTLYNRRLVCGSDESYVIKIILNSLYGKFAEKRKDYIEIDEETAFMLMDKQTTEKTGSRVLECDLGYFIRQIQYGKKSNLMYASLITSYIRNYMYEVMKAIPEKDLVGAMTDCIFTKSPLPEKFVSEKKQLGKFSLKTKSECYVIGSGVYSYMEFDKEKKEMVNKSKLRGYNIKANLIDLAKANGDKNELRIDSTERKGMGKLVVQGIDLSQLNEITDTDKALNLNFDNKREWYRGGFENFNASLKTFISSKTIHK